MREILIYIENAKSRIRLNAGEDVESVERRNAAIYDLRVHELALQSLSQGAVRDEVLEEAAIHLDNLGWAAQPDRAEKACWKRAAQAIRALQKSHAKEVTAKEQSGSIELVRHSLKGDSLHGHAMCEDPNGRWVTYNQAINAIAALKREPNAAGPAGQESWATPSPEGHAAGPAPAAPDVASMVKQRLDNDDAYLQGFEAGQLARLGQGWIPVSERLPQDDTSPVLVNYRAAFHTRKFASGKAKRHRVMFAIFSGGKWRFTLKHEKTRLSERVTHWMPLPPAPGASDD